MNKSNHLIISNSIDRLRKNSFLGLLIRLFRLGPLAKHLYYKTFCPPSRTLELFFKGVSAQFYAENYDALLALETTFSNEGKTEEKMLQPLIDTLQHGDVAYDIGANMGIHTIFMAKKVKDSGKVIAFEPENRAFRALQKNIQLNALQNVKPVPYALGNKTEVRSLYNQPNIGIGASGLIKVPNSRYKQRVKVFTGDEIATYENLPLPHVVKIDVEGFEYSVLKGLKNTLSQKECRLVCCEIHANLVPHGIDSSSIFRLLNSYGFTNFAKWSRGGEIHAVFCK